MLKNIYLNSVNTILFYFSLSYSVGNKQQVSIIPAYKEKKAQKG